MIRFSRISRKPTHLVTACLAFVAAGALVMAAYGNRSIQAYSAPTSVESHGKPAAQQTGGTAFRISKPLDALAQYSLCFHYNTTGLAKPVLQLGDATDGPSGAPPIRIELPRNSFGLGDACLQITPRFDYRHPVLAFSDQGDGESAMLVRDWTLSHSAVAILHPFDYPVLRNGVADVDLENNFLRPNFILPLVLFVALWLGSGVVLSSCISGLNRLEIVLLAPLAGMTFAAFLAYVLSLLGIYSAVSFTLCSVAATLAVLRRKSALGQPIWPLGTRSLASGSPLGIRSDGVFDIIAALLIFYMLSKYAVAAATPFFATWDGLVSWNKWGIDWATRELRGNYQFTYPQMIPLFYSGYYRLAGYSAADPLGLPMNVAHIFITYIGLLALPLVYACSKALRISPVIPVSLILLDGSFFDGMNRGYVDNALATYNLACALLILRVKAGEGMRQNLLSAIVVCMVGAGAIFLKQTGIFATAAVLTFLLVHYRGLLPFRSMLFWGALALFVPVEFYLHELILDWHPSVVEDNPFNHSIGGLLSNAAIQRGLLPDHLTWYGMLVAKMAALAKLPLPSGVAQAKPALLLTALVIIGLYGKVLVGLSRARQWRYALIWGGIIGGQLVIAAKFGKPAFGDSEELRYTMILMPALALLGGLVAAKFAPWFKWAGQSGFRLLRIAGLSAFVIYTTIVVGAFEPVDAAAESVNGFDTVSFDLRLARFYSVDNARVNEFLVSQKNQDFRLFTESDFVVRPYTIFDAANKSTPTKLSQISRPGDYWYSTQTGNCPLGFDKIPLDLHGAALCRKR